MTPILDGGAADGGGLPPIDGGGAGDVAILSVDGGPAGTRAYIPPLATAPPRGGDPRLIMTPNGTRLQFTGGQPLMDAGLENLVLISLFTNEGWCGNGFMKSAIGSDFEEACNQPITRQALLEIKSAAERALIDPALGRVSVTVTNPQGHRLSVRIRIEPPASNPRELTLSRNGANWINQATDPAYRQIRSH